VRARLLLVVLILSAHATAEAQLDRLIKAGARVRIKSSLPDSARITGRIVEVDGDTLVVEPEKLQPFMRFSVSDVAELSIHHRGKAGHENAAALGTIGFLTGSILYLGWCAQNLDECSRYERIDDDPYDDEDTSSSLFVVVALGSALACCQRATVWRRSSLFLLRV
jgi:hypothetical protein